MTVELVEIEVGDLPDVWRSLGFSISDEGAVDIDGVVVRTGGSGPGITGWTLRGLEVGTLAIDGLAVRPAPPQAAADADTASPDEGASSASTPAHPNGVTGIDHVVLATPDLPRTIEALTVAGLSLRRVRDVGRDRSGTVRQQAFFWLGRVILEVVGPAEPVGDGPPTLWGLALTGDLDVARAHLGDRLRTPKPAVQPGRMIATIDPDAGSTVPIVVMSPHRSGEGVTRTPGRRQPS